MSEALRKHRTVVRSATIHQHSQMPIYGTSKRRVAAYARVSTDSEEQLNSYETQLGYYTQYIKSRDDWEFVDIYADEGLSGLRLKHRDDFNRMVEDAMNGKIDLIIAKSVSRFARNTVDTLNIVRMLKAKGVEVRFEKENIDTFDPKAELILTILASLAQEESRSISENVSWGVRAKFKEGKFTLPYKKFLGYKRGDDGMPEIIPEEAEIVKRIYALFLSGNTSVMIANELTSEGIPTPSGKAKWLAGTIESILTNEKYCGDAILQKTFTPDYLTGIKKVNEGELAQYHHTGTHEGIVAPSTFEMVQSEIERRKVLGRRYSGKDPFSSRIICGECGGLYGGKVWCSNTKYRRTIFRCNQKYNKDNAACSTPHFTEDGIKDAFLTVFNRMLRDTSKFEIILACRNAVEVVMDTTIQEKRILKMSTEIDEIATLIRSHIHENASRTLNQDNYVRKHEELVTRLNKASAQKMEAENEIQSRRQRCVEMELYLDTLAECGNIVTEFDSYLWNMVIETATVHKDGAIVFRFKDGREGVWK